MQLSVRVTPELNQRIVAVAEELRLKRSDIVRMALHKFLSAKEETPYPYDRIKHLIGKVESGIPDLGTNHRQHLLERFKKDASGTA